MLGVELLPVDWGATTEVRDRLDVDCGRVGVVGPVAIVVRSAID